MLVARVPGAVMVSTASPAPVPTVMTVTSWYDSGIRLNAADAVASAAPETLAAGAFTANGLVWSSFDATADISGWRERTAAAVAEVASRPRDALWNPDLVTLDDVPAGPDGKVKEIANKLLKDQVVDEYVKASPPYLTGEMVGDNGFDPLCLVALARPTKAAGGYVGNTVPKTAVERQERMAAMHPDDQRKNLAWMREAEIKHARLAMLAAAGWPLAELFNGNWLREVAGTGGRAPALFNGHLDSVGPFLFLAAGATAYIEATTLDNVEGLTKSGYVAGDLGFDPLGYSTGTGLAAELPKEVEGKAVPYPNLGNKKALLTSEIKHGRAAMLAITGFAVQEALWGIPVVEQTPWFFGR